MHLTLYVTEPSLQSRGSMQAIPLLGVEPADGNRTLQLTWLKTRLTWLETQKNPGFPGFFVVRGGGLEPPPPFED